MKKYALITILVLLVYIFIPCSIVPAHQQNVIGWGEEIGWSVNEPGHQATNSIVYSVYKGADYFDSDLGFTALAVTTEEETMIENGAQLWRNTGYVTITNNGNTSVSNSPNIVCAGSNANTNIVGYCHRHWGSDGHITYYKIWFNRAKSAKTVTLAHEFGHAFGLADLYEKGSNDIYINNKNKLMYGIQDRTAIAPTTHDIFGILVATHQHTNHNFEPYNHIYFDANNHTNSCNQCNGIKRNSDGSLSLEPHNMLPATCTSPSRCSDCIYTQGNPLSHSWLLVTCELPERCANCGTAKPGSTPLGTTECLPTVTILKGAAGAVLQNPAGRLH